MTAALQTVAAAQSHVGRVRKANEDSWSYALEAGLFAVCDGMGGAAGGEIASRTALEAFMERLTLVPANDRSLAVVAQAVGGANRRVWTRAAQEAVLKGMGTTLVALASCGPREWVLAHVGDSRCYRWRGGLLQQMTADHSFVAEQVRLGLLSPEQAARSPMRNVITRALGTRETVEPEVAMLAAEPGDVLLLCSDGLTREIPDERIAEVLRQTLPLAERNALLIEAALEAGGRDNVTAMLLEVL